MTLEKQARMRCLLGIPVVLVAACSATPSEQGSPIPDAACSDIGAFEIAAPRPALRYPAALDVYVNEIELWAELTLTMTDDLGRSYAWLRDSSAPYVGDGNWWNQDTFHYELAPNHRYTLTVSHCSDVQTVTFFTE